MNCYNSDFWNALDELVDNSEIIIDRPKGTSHPKYPNFVYQVDYGYLKYQNHPYFYNKKIKSEDLILKIIFHFVLLLSV